MEIQALNSGLQGIQTGMNNLRKDASDIAQAGTQADTTASNPNPAAPSTSRPDVASSLVSLKQDTLQVEASAKVVKAADDVLGSLIDERV